MDPGFRGQHVVL